MIKRYLQMIKLRIIFSNLLSVSGGFFLAAKGQIDYVLFFFTLIGVLLVVASSCVFNNYIDRDIDRKMERTKNRVLVTGLISLKFSVACAALLGITGFSLLYLAVNMLTMWFSIVGFFIYVIIYSLYMKRKSVHATLIGSLSGAMPPVIGYCAVSNQFDICALILLIIFSLWQIPHFYAIAIFHFQDYKAASIPVLPVKHGIFVTKCHIVLYIVGFIAATFMLTLGGYTGYKYLTVASTIGVCWLCMALKGYKYKNNDKIWARKLFVFSIIVITSISVMISIDFIVPSFSDLLT